MPGTVTVGVPFAVSVSQQATGLECGTISYNFEIDGSFADHGWGWPNISTNLVAQSAGQHDLSVFYLCVSCDGYPQMRFASFEAECSDQQRYNFHNSRFEKNITTGFNMSAPNLAFTANIPVKIIGENPDTGPTPLFDKLTNDVSNYWNGTRSYGGAQISVNIQFELKPITYFGPHLDFFTDAGLFIEDGNILGKAEQGGDWMRIRDSNVHARVTAHEIGHILGFADAYESGAGPFPCHESDIMSNASNTGVKGYHNQTLIINY